MAGDAYRRRSSPPPRSASKYATAGAMNSARSHVGWLARIRAASVFRDCPAPPPRLARVAATSAQESSAPRAPDTRLAS